MSPGSIVVGAAGALAARVLAWWLMPYAFAVWWKLRSPYPWAYRDLVKEVRNFQKRDRRWTR